MRFSRHLVRREALPIRMEVKDLRRLPCRSRGRSRRWVHRGAGPDRIETTASTSLTGVPIQSQDSAHHDQMVYEVGE